MTTRETGCCASSGAAAKSKDPDREPRPRIRATYTRTQGIRHLFAALDLGKDKMYGHIKKRKRRGEFLEFCRYLRSLYPPEVRIAIICDNFSPHLTTKKDKRVGEWAEADNVEIAHTPTSSSWLNRIEAQFTALREFTLNGTDHASHRAGQHDPPLYRLAKPQHRQPTPTPHREEGKRGLTRHEEAGGAGVEK
ncbi:transposase [Nonomuraea sp. B12E4]|uniref:transposase n=1 Tax=Nonomuraea sp. B12E4 TaxID=3153564 RepID=UPI00325EF443